MTPPPWLTDEEIQSLTDGLTQAAARCRFLRKLGLTVRAKPNGDPLVMRANVEEVLGPRATGKKTNGGKAGPNRSGLENLFTKPNRPAGV